MGDISEEDFQDTVQIQKWERSGFKTTAYIVTSFIAAVAIALALNGAIDHNVLVRIGDRIPLMNSIGNFFHTKKTENKQSDSPVVDLELNPNWNWNDGPKAGARLLTDSEISFVEEKGTKPYLVIVGNVFDVSSNYESYKAGSGYHGFIGQDGTRAFVTGDFTPAGLISDLDGLKPDDYLGLVKWMSFYFKTYPHVGYHIGRFYDKSGQETDYFKNLRTWVKEAEKVEEDDGNLKKQFPPCNMEWSAKTEMTEYWCSKKSGGIERDWEGYPYQFKEDDKSYRCACIHTNHLKDPRVKPYENCPAKSRRCKMPSPKNK